MKHVTQGLACSLYNPRACDVLLPGDVIPVTLPRSQGDRTYEGDEPMKRAIRMLFLMVGLVFAYEAIAAPSLPAPDGGPIPVCNPNTGCGGGK